MKGAREDVGLRTSALKFDNQWRIQDFMLGRGEGCTKIIFLENNSWRVKKKDHQNSVKTLHLSKKFTSKLTRAERERKFLTIFQTFEWIFLQNIQNITKYE